MHKKYEMNKVDSPTIPTQPGVVAKPKKPIFVSPYTYGDELVYTEVGAKTNVFGHTTPAKTSRVIYVGLSYIEYGEDFPPQAIVKRDSLNQEQLRVEFSTLTKAD